MAYDRINWENTPSTNTPLNADNLNNMDAALANLDNLIAAANELITQLQSAVSLLDARMDTFVTLQDGSTTGDAEIIDARIGYDGTVWTNVGDAIRGQITDCCATVEGTKLIIGGNNG